MEFCDMEKPVIKKESFKSQRGKVDEIGTSDGNSSEMSVIKNEAYKVNFSET
jgi:hypothetical protein